MRESGWDRIAGTWYSSSSFIIDLNMTDPAQHQIALYCLDWDSTSRRETIDVLDANGNVLNSQNLSSSFNAGVYLVWNVSGHVKVRVTVSLPGEFLPNLYSNARLVVLTPGN